MRIKVPFWNSRGRRGVFLIGSIFFALGVCGTIYISTEMRSWVETPITARYETGGFCEDGPHVRLEYIVGNKKYHLSECLSQNASVSKISYNPNNPSQAVINTVDVWRALAATSTIFGGILILASILLRDPRPGELGYSPDNHI
jgi:hypothetical protein